MKNFKTLTALAAAGLIATGGTASAATLFADSFDRADGTDLNAATTGKSGSLGALAWTEVNGGATGPNASIVNNTLTIGENNTGGGAAGYSTAYLNHNFIGSAITTGGEFTVSVDLVGALSSNGGTRFTGFSIGNSLANVTGWSANNPASFASDFFFGYDASGTTEVKIFSGGSQLYQQGINLSGATTDTLSVRFSGISDFDAGSSVSYEAFINGGTAVKTGTFTWSGTDENYMNVYSNYSNFGTVDNFSVTAVPEPSSAALLGLAGLALILRRRR